MSSVAGEASSSESAPDGPAPVEAPETEPKSDGATSKVALWGIIATLAAGVIGSLTTYFAAMNQADREAERSAMEFKRDKQLVAYSDFASSVYGVTQAADGLVGAMVQAKPGAAPEPILAQFDAFRNALIGASQKQVVVVLLGSRDAVEAADAVAESLRELDALARAKMVEFDERTFDMSDVDELNAEGRDVGRAQLDFLTAARGDLN